MKKRKEKIQQKITKNWTEIYILIAAPKLKETKSKEKEVGARVKMQCSEVHHHLTHNAIKFIKHEEVLNVKQSCSVLEICTLKIKK